MSHTERKAKQDRQTYIFFLISPHSFIQMSKIIKMIIERREKNPEFHLFTIKNDTPNEQSLIEINKIKILQTE